MSNPDYSFWNLLKPVSDLTEAMSARIPFPDLYDQQLAAVDSQGRRHFLIPISAGDDALTDTRSRGVTVRTEELRVRNSFEDTPPTRYIDILCLDPSLYDGFNLIGFQIAETIAQGGLTETKAVGRVLSKWRYFWSRASASTLTRSEIIGLFTELWFICKWLLPYTDVGSVISSWRGPLQGRHDFQWPYLSVEAKGTTSVHGKRHWIHGLDQLSSPENGKLFLFSLQLREENGASSTLPSLVTMCHQSLEGNMEAMDIFDALLAEVGYFPDHEMEYNKLHFRVVDEGLYFVDGTFPRITESAFGEGIRPGVIAIDYEISLDGFEGNIVAKMPRDGLF